MISIQDKKFCLDNDELQDAIDSVDTTKYSDPVNIDTFRELLRRYYERKSKKTVGCFVSGLVMECSRSFDFDLHYGYCVATFSFISKHRAKKEVVQTIEKDKKSSVKEIEQFELPIVDANKEIQALHY
jgi:hypothetical protein